MQPEDRRLCDELLTIGKQEMIALGTGNLEEIENCLARKVSILEKLTVIPPETGDTRRLAEELRGVLERVSHTHNKVRDGILGMLEACAEELVGIGTGRRVHRAYQQRRAGKAALAGGTSGSRRRGLGKRNHVL